jgi:hypothetical protein
MFGEGGTRGRGTVLVIMQTSKGYDRSRAYMEPAFNPYQEHV